MHTLEDVTAHYFCLLFASGLTQKGGYEDGIQGFLLDDIRRELRRGKFLKCSYCRKRGAVVGCLVAECSANYHFPCGIENGAYNDFHHESNSYPSHCKKHRPKNLPKDVSPPKSEVLCTICQEMIKPRSRAKLFLTDCCNSYYHNACMQQLAYHKGLHYRCPNCLNQDKFIRNSKRNNIFVEMRHFYFPVMTEIFDCSAPECLCENGRRYNGTREWELYACDLCGGNATHIRCGGLSVDVNFWMCEICRNV